MYKRQPLYSKDVWKDRADGDKILRGLKSEPKLQVLRNELSRRSTKRMKEGKVEQKLSYYRVWISGIFYRTYENEQMGVKPNFMGVVYRHNNTVYKLDLSLIHICKELEPSHVLTSMGLTQEQARSSIDVYKRQELN